MNWVCLALLSSAATADYERANQLFQQGRFGEARQALDRALARDPNLVPALTLKGKLAMGLNRFDDAREAFSRAVRLDPESPYTQFLLGFFYYVDNDFQRALAPLEKSAKLNPLYSRATFYLALTQEGLGKADVAIRYYERTIELEETKPSAETFVAYGRLLFTLGRYGESRQHIERALQLDPNSRDAHYERGRLLFEEDKFAEAAGEGERALSVPGAGTLERQIHFLLARAYAKKGDRVKADEHLAKFKASGVSLRR